MATAAVKSKKEPFVTVYGVVALLLAVALLIAASLPSSGVFNAGKRAALSNELNQVQTAVLNYYTEYSEYPVTSDNATLIKILTGLTATENSRQIAFLTVKPSDENAKGELLDPWGTPLEMSVTHDGVIHLRSAGPDKIFGTADDITNQIAQRQ
jgi:hypothetical protein